MAAGVRRRPARQRYPPSPSPPGPPALTRPAEAERAEEEADAVASMPEATAPSLPPGVRGLVRGELRLAVGGAAWTNTSAKVKATVQPRFWGEAGPGPPLALRHGLQWAPRTEGRADPYITFQICCAPKHFSRYLKDSEPLELAIVDAFSKKVLGRCAVPLRGLDIHYPICGTFPVKASTDVELGQLEVGLNLQYFTEVVSSFELNEHLAQTDHNLPLFPDAGAAGGGPAGLPPVEEQSPAPLPRSPLQMISQEAGHVRVQQPKLAPRPLPLADLTNTVPEAEAPAPEGKPAAPQPPAAVGLDDLIARAQHLRDAMATAASNVVPAGFGLRGPEDVGGPAGAPEPKSVFHELLAKSLEQDDLATLLDGAGGVLPGRVGDDDLVSEASSTDGSASHVDVEDALIQELFLKQSAEGFAFERPTPVAEEAAEPAAAGAEPDDAEPAGDAAAVEHLRVALSALRCSQPDVALEVALRLTQQKGVGARVAVRKGDAAPQEARIAVPEQIRSTRALPTQHFLVLEFWEMAKGDLWGLAKVKVDYPEGPPETPATLVACVQPITNPILGTVMGDIGLTVDLHPAPTAAAGPPAEDEHAGEAAAPGVERAAAGDASREVPPTREFEITILGVEAIPGTSEAALGRYMCYSFPGEEDVLCTDVIPVGSSAAFNACACHTLGDAGVDGKLRFELWDKLGTMDLDEADDDDILQFAKEVPLETVFGLIGGQEGAEAKYTFLMESRGSRVGAAGPAMEISIRVPERGAGSAEPGAADDGESGEGHAREGEEEVVEETPSEPAVQEEEEGAAAAGVSDAAEEAVEGAAEGVDGPPEPELPLESPVKDLVQSLLEDKGAFEVPASLHVHVERACGLRSAIEAAEAKYVDMDGISPLSESLIVGPNTYFVLELFPDTADDAIKGSFQAEAFNPVYDDHADVHIALTAQSLSYIANEALSFRIVQRVAGLDEAGTAQDVRICAGTVPLFPLLTSSKGVKGWYPLKSIEEEIVGAVKLHAFFTSIDNERMSASGDSSYSALELFPKVAAHLDPGSTAARVANSQLLSLSVQQIKACVYIEDFNLPFEELFKCQSSSSVEYHVRYTFPGATETTASSPKCPVVLGSGQTQVPMNHCATAVIASLTEFRRSVTGSQMEIEVWRQDVVHEYGDRRSEPAKVGSCYVDMTPLLVQAPGSNKGTRWFSGMYSVVPCDGANPLGGFKMRVKVILDISTIPPMRAAGTAAADAPEEGAGGPAVEARAESSRSSETRGVQTTKEDEASIILAAPIAVPAKEEPNIHFCVESALHLFLGHSLKDVSSNQHYVYCSYDFGDHGTVVTPLAHCKVETTSSINMRCSWFHTSQLLLKGEEEGDRATSDRIVVLKVWHRATDTAETLEYPATQKAKDALLGCAAMDISPMLHGLQEICGWYNVIDHHQVSKGQLKVKAAAIDGRPLTHPKKRSAAPYRPEPALDAGVAAAGGMAADGTALPPPNYDVALPLAVFSKPGEEVVKNVRNELEELAQRLKSRLADLDGTPPEAPREEGEAGSAGAGAPAVDAAAPEESFSLSELSLNISALDESVIAGKSPLGAASFNDAPEDLDVSRASSAARRRLYNNEEIDRMARIMGSRQ